ncbi:MAG: hypothetical protein IPG44_12965 [Anaerolineales bacterium]|nr:hypothetical protein [Anaerolineales bacterium]
MARINSVGSGWEKDDIEAVLPYHPDGIVIPKVESFEQVEWASRIIEDAELKNGWGVNSIRILIGVETAKGILNLKEIAAHPRLDAVIFGGEDFAASVGATRTKDAIELLYARQTVVVARRTICRRLTSSRLTIRIWMRSKPRRSREQDRLQRETGHSNLNQVPATQEAFTPSAEAIAHARRESSRP